MFNRSLNFDFVIPWKFPEGRRYSFPFISLFVILIIIYANSFLGAWQFDDAPNIIDNKNVHLKSLNLKDIRTALHDPQNKISRPFSYLCFSVNYYFDGLNPLGYHIINFIIHYLSSVFLFLFIYNTLNLPLAQDKHGPSSYSIALLGTVFWSTNPLQVTAVTYIVQRMASMAGLYYIMSMYFYLKARTTDSSHNKLLMISLCVICSIISFGSKENAIMIPISILLFDILLIQGATSSNIIRNIRYIVPASLIIFSIGLYYIDLPSILSGAAYSNRPFTLIERLLTQPRVLIFYISLFFYPINSRLTLIHDIETSKSLLIPWTTLPAIFLLLILLIVAIYLARRKPIISFCIIFFFINHITESSFIALEMIYEHRNYIPSMFLSIPALFLISKVINYFRYSRSIQAAILALVTIALATQAHTVYARNFLFQHSLLLWTDNVHKTQTLSRPYNNLGSAYWNLGFYDKAFELYTKALLIDKQTNLMNKSVNLHNIGMYYLHVKKDYNIALEYFRSAIDLNPTYWPSLHEATACLIMKNDFKEARRIINHALLNWPQNPELLTMAAYLSLRIGEIQKSENLARYALSLNSNLPAPLPILGEVSRRKHNYYLSTLYWNKYLERKPMDVEALLSLIDLYDILDKKDDVVRTVGVLLSLKGSKGLDDLLNQSLSKPTPILEYRVDRRRIRSIIIRNLAELNLSQ